MLVAGGVLPLLEGRPASGLVARKALIGMLALIVIAVGLAAAGMVTGMRAGAVVFLVPVVLGLSYLLAEGNKTDD